MIIVSTTSPAEARFAEHALSSGLPPDIGYSVYVNGKLSGERAGRAVHPAEPAEWPGDPEVRSS
jgi:hypothetical protein